MKIVTSQQKSKKTQTPQREESLSELHGLNEVSWRLVAPFWPLQSLIAVNPLQGLEDLSFSEALEKGAQLYEQTSFPQEILTLNTISIKYFQAFFDEGQATIEMPLRDQGLLQAWKRLAVYDAELVGKDKNAASWIQSLPDLPEGVLHSSFIRLGLKREDWGHFLTLLLATLPGWAAHVKYLEDWSGQEKKSLKIEFVALRAAILALLWPEEKPISVLLKKQETPLGREKILKEVIAAEETYQEHLLTLLETGDPQAKPDYPLKAQLVFCIDVRSEPMRRAIEARGNYETFGFAGFFGVPVALQKKGERAPYAACPVLLKPEHMVEEPGLEKRSRLSSATFKRLYQSLKYTFTAPLALVETLGPLSGFWMGMRTLFPRITGALYSVVGYLRRRHVAPFDLSGIPLKMQCDMAENALRGMGLTHNFAKYVIFCGHGSQTQNNAYASALDCGACAGHQGGDNAQILAQILNTPSVREQLAQRGIRILEDVTFLAAQHNTTTDDISLFGEAASLPALKEIREDLQKAQQEVSGERIQRLPVRRKKGKRVRSYAWDWAQIRPEWGLAQNAAFIVGPRSITTSMDLEGRTFLHSYDWEQDKDGAILETILTAPMVVAQWINMQYFFSSLNNVAYGGGSKVTKNIVGKHSVMQGNGSDLMTGLPLQSVYAGDNKLYHMPQRLLTVVYAPVARLKKVIHRQEVLQRLFGNEWVHLLCIDPQTGERFSYQDIERIPTREELQKQQRSSRRQS